MISHNSRKVPPFDRKNVDTHCTDETAEEGNTGADCDPVKVGLLFMVIIYMNFFDLKLFQTKHFFTLIFYSNYFDQIFFWAKLFFDPNLFWTKCFFQTRVFLIQNAVESGVWLWHWLSLLSFIIIIDNYFYIIGNVSYCYNHWCGTIVSNYSYFGLLNS